MKTKLNLFLFSMLIALLLVSCKEETLDELKGLYTRPEVMDYTVLDSQIRDKDGSLFVFLVNLNDDASNELNIRFFSSEYALPASDFTASETASNKTYLIGSDGSTCNGQQISTGTISVSVDDNGNYTMNGILYLADETIVRMTASFSVVYEYIPLYTYSIETETPALDNSYAEITGTTKHKISVYGDGVLYAYLDVIAEESATSLSGTYTVKDGIDAVGQVDNGYYMDLSWWDYGTDIYQGGSYYIVNGEKQWLREADDDVITIVDNGSELTIIGENLGILDLETLAAEYGNWSILEEKGSFNIENATGSLNSVLSATIGDLTAYNLGYTIDLELATSGVTAEYNGTTYTTDYTGTGKIIKLNFLMDADTLLPGNYNIVDNASATYGDCIAGYYNETYYSDFGSILTTVTDGTPSSTYINSGGTIELIYEEENYIALINVTTDDCSLKTTYSGAITFQHVVY